MIITLNNKTPSISKSAFVAVNSTIIGDVKIADCASVWFGAVIRGDVNSVKIGKYTNFQDLCVLHVTVEDSAMIGDYVTVGHKALVHACKIGNNCLIGMGSIVMNGAEIGDNTIIGAGALVTQGTKIPAGSLVLGSPAKVKRELTPEEIEMLRKSAINYYGYAKAFIDQKTGI